MAMFDSKNEIEGGLAKVFRRPSCYEQGTKNSTSGTIQTCRPFASFDCTAPSPLVGSTHLALAWLVGVETFVQLLKERNACSRCMVKLEVAPRTSAIMS
jgi:hypothetical protein